MYGNASQSVNFESTVCNGFPVCVEASIFPGDDVYGREVDDISITTPAGKPAKFIEAKMTKDDWDRLEEEALNQC